MLNESTPRTRPNLAMEQTTAPSVFTLSTTISFPSHFTLAKGLPAEKGQP